MKCFEGVVVLLVLALLGACSSVGPGTKEVSGGTTVRLERFSFVLPDGPQWISEDGNSSVNIRMTGVGGMTGSVGLYGVLASSFPLPSVASDEEFTAWVKEKLAQQVAPSEKVSLHEVQPYSLKGARCVRSHMQKAGARGGVSEDSFVLVCAHPAKKGIGVYVEYWQNVLDAPDPKLADKASRLFESVAFTPS